MTANMQEPIVIFRGDNTAAFDLRTIKILLTGDLDITNATARFDLLGFTKSWTTEEVATGELSIVFTAEQTKAFALGPQSGMLRLFDMSTGTPRQLTVVNNIPFFVTNRVCEIDSQSYGINVCVSGGDVIHVEFKVGAGAVEDKADKVKNATAGDLAGLDAVGNLTDSGIPASDVQRKLTFDATPTAGSQNPVTSDGIKQAIDAATPEDYAQVKAQVEQNTSDIATNTENISKNAGDIADNARDIATNAGDIAAIEAKIPAQASAQNQLADKAFVNSSIASNTATFRGSYNLVSDLGLTVSATEQQVAAAIAAKLASLVPPVVPENNDYVFVQVPKTDAGPTVIERVDRYKCTVTESGGVTTRVWGYEWSLNNSSFTADQWAAINSGMTAADVTKLAGIEAGAQVNAVTSVNSKTGAVSLTGADLPVSSSDTTKVDVALGNKLDNSGASEKFIDFGNGNKIGFSYVGTKLSISLYYLNARMASFICDEGTAALENAFGRWAFLPSADGMLALVSQIYAAVQQIAPDFTAKAYALNEPCTYNGVVYHCKSAYTATASSAKPNRDTAHWEAKKVSELFLPLTGGTLYNGITFYNALGVDVSIGAIGGSFYIGNTQIGTSRGGFVAYEKDLAPDYSTSATYAVNDLCVYNGKLYRCTTAITTAEAWTAAHWTEATVEDVLAAIRSELRYDMPTAVALVADNDEATLVCADRAVTNATIASGFSTLNLTFPTAVSGKVRDFYLRITVAAGESAPALSIPQGITIENPDGAVPEIADGETSAAATTLVWFSETAPNVFTAKSETVKAVA